MSDHLIPIEFAAQFNAEQCKAARDENMALARLALPREGSIFFEHGMDMVRAAIGRARIWNRSMIGGGNDAYRYQIARNATREQSK